MTNKKAKVIFDCNIFLQAFLSTKGIASKCFKLVEDNLIELYLSRETLNEVTDVLILFPDRYYAIAFAQAVIK